MIYLQMLWTYRTHIMSAAIAAIIFFNVGRVVGHWEDLSAMKTERDAAQATLMSCQNDQKLTEGVSHDYQTRIRSLNRQLTDLKRLRDNPRCTPIADPSIRRDASSESGKPSGSDGIRSEWLLDFAAEAEQYRLQLISCQSFIKKTWESRDKARAAKGEK